MRRITGVLIAIALGLLLPSAALAAFPGQNGRIAYVNGGDIWTMNPDGTNQVNLTNDAPVQGSPAWSPDGAKIAYDEGPNNSQRIWTMLADGSNRTMAAPVFDTDFDPAWSPDGTRLVFTNKVALFTMNPDGTAVFGPVGPGAGTIDPEWSPSGDLIVYSRAKVNFSCDSSRDRNLGVVAPDGTGSDAITEYCGGPFDSTWSPDEQRIAYSLGNFHTIKPDGTDDQTLANSGVSPSWSPDGTKIAFGTIPSGVGVMDADGTDPVVIATGGEPDWQPILRGYARPKSASPFYASLVPAYEPCTTPNRTHAAPMSFNSCNPPAQTSDFATVGTPDANSQPAKSVGSLKLKAVGEVPINTGNGNQSDLEIDLSYTDVRQAATPANDYTAGLRTHMDLQVTDRNNTPYPGGPGPGTVVPLSFEFDVPCAATPDTTIGGQCTLDTTANALVPGQVLEFQRAIWQLGEVEVYDGGSDANPTTEGDNTLFASQGVFIP